MNFVKTGVYLQEISQSGIKEQEIDTRDPKVKEEEERLKRLPEFCRDPNFKSLAEQLEADALEAEVETNDNVQVTASEEDLEFLDQLENAQRKKQEARAKEEEEELAEFRRSQLQPMKHENIAKEQNYEIEQAPKTSGALEQNKGPRVSLIVKRKRTGKECNKEEMESNRTSKKQNIEAITTVQARNLLVGYDDDDDDDSSDKP